MAERAVAALSLGGNTGDVTGAFRLAIAALDTNSQVNVLARSGVWRTPPWGKTDQPDFLNMAVLVATTLPPRDLLALCLGIEQRAGRERHERWGPRPLDIDIIDYDHQSIVEEGLTLPHPRAVERAFVLVPLAEIAPSLRLDAMSVAERAAASDQSGMARDEAASGRISDA